jgi:hypothetical protein
MRLRRLPFRGVIGMPVGEPREFLRRGEYREGNDRHEFGNSARLHS